MLIAIGIVIVVILLLVNLPDILSNLYWGAVIAALLGGCD